MAEENTPQETAGNQFANDGSFMEMFRKRMEEQQKAKEGLGKKEGKRTESESVQGKNHQKPKQLSAADKPSQVVNEFISVGIRPSVGWVLVSVPDPRTQSRGSGTETTCRWVLGWEVE